MKKDQYAKPCQDSWIYQVPELELPQTYKKT